MQERLNGELLKEMVLSAAALLDKNKKSLNALNVFPVPDGDTGTNMSLTMMSAVKEVRSADTSRISQVGDALSLGALKGARGNSGVILSQLFRGLSKSLAGLETAGPSDFAKAMQEGVDAAYKAVMKPKEGTILTVAREMAKEALRSASKGENIYMLIDAVIENGTQILKKTPDMLPVLKEAGVVDAGGKGLLVIYRGFKMALDGEAITDNLEVEPETSVDFSNAVGSEDIEFGYCTEFFIKDIHDAVTQDDIDRYREKLMKIGDCVLVVGDLQLIKTHVHTNVPGKALQFALRFGELSRIKIDNMREQHTELFEHQDDIEPKPNKEMAVVTVAAGEGIVNIFKEFLVDEIVEGGQTMNPSAETITQAIERAPSNNVFVFPNNKNIILAAEQAAQFSSKNVHVIPSSSIPQGITGVLAFNPDLGFQENSERMNKAIDTVKTGQVTSAVRESRLNGQSIKKGEIIGILDGDIICHTGDVFETCRQLLKSMVTDDDSVITIFYGEGVTQELANQMGDLVKEEYDDFDVELQFGGQPVYPFVFAVE